MLLDPRLENDVGSVSADIRFPAKYREKENGPPESKILEWNENNENLVELYPALFISIFNGDWEE